MPAGNFLCLSFATSASFLAYLTYATLTNLWWMPFIRVKQHRVTITHNQFQLSTEDDALVYREKEDWGSQVSL